MPIYGHVCRSPQISSPAVRQSRSLPICPSFFFMTEGIKLSLTHTMKLYQISFGRVYAVVRTYSRKIPKDIQPCSPRWNPKDTFSPTRTTLTPQSSLFRDQNCWAVSQPFSLGAVKDVSSTDNDVHASPTAKYSETSVEKGKRMFASQARIMLVRSCRKDENRKVWCINNKQTFFSFSLFLINLPQIDWKSKRVHDRFL